MQTTNKIKQLAFLTTLAVSTMSVASISGTMEEFKGGNLEGAFTQLFSKSTLDDFNITPQAKVEEVELKGTDFSAFKMKKVEDQQVSNEVDFDFTAVKGFFANAMEEFKVKF